MIVNARATCRALPVIRPVNHVLDGDTVIIRTQTGSALIGGSTVARHHG
ncbi:pyridoxamine 5'-phosphate oxidase family protein [Streptomyces sp. STR69]|nr:pyridoxamine 5'-phosphate oxidase family protein [Streptomyces sp. STR69]